MAEKHRVVILGGGFGGLYAAKALGKAPVDVTVIDRRNYHLFKPLLYQVATGALSPGEIAAPLRGVLGRRRNTRVLLGEAADIDTGAHLVTLRDGARVPYDSLIVATGSESSYYGNDSWREWAPSLKSVEEATAVRHKILYAFEAAERVANPAERRAWLTFAIVGGGTTGLELAGALAEIARRTLRHNFRSIHPETADIVLLEWAPRILPGYPGDLSAKAARSLAKLGVRVRTNVRVTGIDRDGVDIATEDGAERLPAKTVLWAGGITASAFGRTLAARTGAETDRTGRIRVHPDLSIAGHPDIRVVGDLALALRPDGRPLPGVAQVAMQQGAYAAKAVVARLRGSPDIPPFRYFDRGDMAVIGRAEAVADLFGFHVSGTAAWLVWLFVHLMSLVEFRSRVLVFIQWGFLYLTFSRGARLITGASPSDLAAEDASRRDAA